MICSASISAMALIYLYNFFASFLSLAVKITSSSLTWKIRSFLGVILLFAFINLVKVWSFKVNLLSLSTKIYKLFPIASLIPKALSILGSAIIFVKSALSNSTGSLSLIWINLLLILFLIAKAYSPYLVYSPLVNDSPPNVVNIVVSAKISILNLLSDIKTIVPSLLLWAKALILKSFGSFPKICALLIAPLISLDVWWLLFISVIIIGSVEYSPDTSVNIKVSFLAPNFTIKPVEDSRICELLNDTKFQPLFVLSNEYVFLGISVCENLNPV